MISPPNPAATQETTSPLRHRFLHRLETVSIKPTARQYYIRWAESWTKARGHQSPERTEAYFDALGRSAHLADWQFRQAVDAARILACEILAIPWASSFPWQALSKQARSLEPEHRTLARETIQVRSGLPIVAGASRLQSFDTDLQTDLTTLIDFLRRAIRLKDYAVATEETYVYWNRRFIRFCHLKLGQASSRIRDFARASRYIITCLDHVSLRLSTRQHRSSGPSLYWANP